MVKVLLKKSLKSKLFIGLFIFFLLFGIVFLFYPIAISTLLSGSFTVGMTNNLMWGLLFCIIMLVILILQLVLKSIIFDQDLKFLIKVELQYQVKKRTIYFSRWVVLVIYTFLYITILLISYFIYIGIFVPGHMKIRIFLASTVGYIGYLYPFSLGTIAVLFLVTFIKNHGLRFSIPFLLLFSLIGTTLYSQFSMVPASSASSYQSFISNEQTLMDYQKFEKSQLLKQYQSYFDQTGLIPAIKSDIALIFPANQKLNYRDYNMFLKHQTYHGMQPSINYQPNNRSLANIFADLAAKGSVQYQPFYRLLASLYHHFELDNMFNRNLLSYGINSLGFIAEENYHNHAYNPKTQQYTISIDAYAAEVFSKLAKQYAGTINQQMVTRFQQDFVSFKTTMRTTAYGFFWKQPSYLLAGHTSNVPDDLARVATYMMSAPVARLINFHFTPTASGYLITNAQTENIYSYELLVILYLFIITLMNYSAYVVFSHKIIE